MIWVKSFVLGLLTMLIGSIATLIGFMVYLGHQISREHVTVGTDFVHVRVLSPTALLVYSAWFLAGAALAYWLLKRRRNRSLAA